MAERISFGDTLILKGEKLLLDNGANDGIIKSKNGTLKIDGNLTVTGITTTVDSETVTMQDNIIVLNSNAIGSATENSGIEIERGDDTNVTIIWDETDDKWTVGSHTFVAATFEGNLTGDVTGSVTGDITSTGTSIFSGIDINGGTIDGTPIGVTNPQVGTFTTLTATTINGPLTGTVTGTVSSISNHDTDDLAEGSTNLYYTDSRVDTHLNKINPTSGYVLSWNGSDYSWVAQTGGSSYSDSDVATYLGGNLDTHILPDTNDTYDIGSASFKIRDLYLGDNSLHIGDNTVSTSGSKLMLNGEDVMDYSNITSKPTIPTAVSQLTNDSSFLTSVPAQSFASLTGKPTTLAGYGITDGGGSGGAYALSGYTEIPSIIKEITHAQESISTSEYLALTISGTLTKLIDTNKNTIVPFKLIDSGESFTVTPTESASTLEINIEVDPDRTINKNLWGNISPDGDNGDGTWSANNSYGWIPVIYKDSDIVSNVLTTWVEPKNTADDYAKNHSTWTGGDMSGWRFTETPGNTSAITYKLGWILWKTGSSAVNFTSAGADFKITDAHVKDIRVQVNSAFSGAYGDLTGKPTIGNLPVQTTTMSSLSSNSASPTMIDLTSYSGLVVNAPVSGTERFIEIPSGTTSGQRFFWIKLGSGGNQVLLKATIANATTGSTETADNLSEGEYVWTGTFWARLA